MTSSRSLRTKLAALTLTGAFALAACGGSESSSDEPAEQLPAVADVLEVSATADVASNQLPDLIVDNLNDDNKVNLRNFGVSDKPILLWMYAPH